MHCTFYIKYRNFLSFDSLKYQKSLSSWGLCPQTPASGNSMLVLEPPSKNPHVGTSTRQTAEGNELEFTI